MAPRDEADVVVIGSGAGGAPVALTLAEAGARVVVLERGSYYTVRDFTHDEVAICLRDFFVPYPFRNHDPHILRNKGSSETFWTQNGWVGVCVGGGTVHMSGFTYRFKEQDLRLATLTGGIEGSTIADWPIGYDELVPFYDLAEVRIGVSGQAGVNPFDPPRRPFPLPPLKPHPAAFLVDAAARSGGFHPFPTPRAILSRPYGNRPPCNYCGFCGEYGCENGSKSSTLASLLPLAEVTGRCQIRPNCMAVRIVAGDDDRVRAVEYIDSRGETRTIAARVVCLAATAIESARLLLLSQSARFPDGLANRSGLVGRNLTFSGFGKVTAVFDRHALVARLGEDDMDLPFLQRSVQDDYWNPKNGLRSPKGGTYNFLLHHPNPINAGVRLALDSEWRLWGQPLKDRLKKYFQDELWMEAEIFGEFLPTQDCYVELDPAVTDRFGLPVARINHARHPLTEEITKFMVRRGWGIFQAMKPAPTEVKAAAWNGTTWHLQHGTCRFGDDPGRSVLDRFCQSHDVKNLYVTDGSFMPTSGGVPATPTILANSFRVAHHLAGRFRRREI